MQIIWLTLKFGAALLLPLEGSETSSSDVSSRSRLWSPPFFELIVSRIRLSMTGVYCFVPGWSQNMERFEVINTEILRSF